MFPMLTLVLANVKCNGTFNLMMILMVGVVQGGSRSYSFTNKIKALVYKYIDVSIYNIQMYWI